MTIDAQRYLKWTRRNFPPPWAARVAAAYSLDDYTPFWAAAHAVGDLVVHCPTRRAAVALAARDGSNATGSNTSVFVYSFTHAPISMRLSDGPCAAAAGRLPRRESVRLRRREVPEDAARAQPRARGVALLPQLCLLGRPVGAAAVGGLDNATSVPWPRFDNASYTRMLLGTRPDGTLRTQSGERARRPTTCGRVLGRGRPAPAAGPATTRRDVRAAAGGASRAIYVDTLDEDEEDEVEQEASS